MELARGRVEVEATPSEFMPKEGLMLLPAVKLPNRFAQTTKALEIECQTFRTKFVTIAIDSNVDEARTKYVLYGHTGELEDQGTAWSRPACA